MVTGRLVATSMLISFLLAVPSEAQYFLPLGDAKTKSLTTEFHMSSASSTFDSKAATTRKVGTDTVQFVPAVRTKGATLKELADGIVLGEWVTDKDGYLGAMKKKPLRAGTYQIWLARRSLVWVILATDSSGTIKAVTNEVILHMDRDDTAPLFSKVAADIMIPPYALAIENHGITTLSDEGPGTVHGCGCRHAWAHIKDPNDGDRTVCWPWEGDCHCW